MLTGVDVDCDGLHRTRRLNAAECLGRRPPECLARHLVVGEHDRHARLSSHAEGLWWQGSREKTGIMASGDGSKRTAGWEDRHQWHQAMPGEDSKPQEDSGKREAGEKTARGQRWVCLVTPSIASKISPDSLRRCVVSAEQQQQHCSARGDRRDRAW